MAGRAPIKVYQYDANGKYMKEWACTNDVRRAYYPDDKGRRPLFEESRAPYKGKPYPKKEYHNLPDGTFVSKYRIGRDRIIQLERIANSPYCYQDNSKSKVVEVYNMEGKKIANFRNATLASMLTGIDVATINSQCNQGKGKKYTKSGLLFKYKQK